MEGITIDFATAKDVKDMHEFMLSEFLKNSNLNAPIGLTREDAYETYLRLIEHCVASRTCLVLRNEDGEIIAMRLSVFADRGEQAHELTYPNRIQLIIDFCCELTKNIWDLIPSDVNRVFYIETLSVSEKYRRRGLAKILTSHGLEEVRAAGATAAVSESTSIASQMLFEQLGYRTLREIRHDEYLGADGKPMFDCEDGTKTARFVFKYL